MACSYCVRKDSWYYPWIKSMFGLGRPFFSLFPFTCTFDSGILLLYMARRSPSLHTPFGYPLGPPSPPSPQPLVPCKDPLASQPHSHASPNSIHCPLQTFSSSFLEPMTWMMGRAEWRKKETRGWGVAGKIERPKKRESPICRFTVISYNAWAHGKWISVLCTWPLWFHLYTVLPDGEWRCPVNWGSFQRQDVGKSYLAYMNTVGWVSYFSLAKISCPFLLGNGFCPVVLNIQTGNLTKSHSSKYLGRTTARAPPTSLLLGWSSLGSTILNSQMLRENKNPAWNPPEETRCLRPDGFPHASAVAVPQSWGHKHSMGGLVDNHIAMF